MRINAPPWLVGVKRRTLEDIKEFLGPSQICRLITAKTRPYKTQWDFTHPRNKALIALLCLRCGRITEVLSLKKSQFVIDEGPEFVIITNMVVVEPKKKQRKAPPIRAEVPLPKERSLAKFTKLVVEYLRMLRKTLSRLNFRGVGLDKLSDT